MFILHSDQFKSKSYLKLIKKYIISECEQFLLKETAHLRIFGLFVCLFVCLFVLFC